MDPLPKRRLVNSGFLGLVLLIDEKVSAAGVALEESNEILLLERPFIFFFLYFFFFFIIFFFKIFFVVWRWNGRIPLA